MILENISSLILEIETIEKAIKQVELLQHNYFGSDPTSVARIIKNSSSDPMFHNSLKTMSNRIGISIKELEYLILKISQGESIEEFKTSLNSIHRIFNNPYDFAIKLDGVIRQYLHPSVINIWEYLLISLKTHPTEIAITILLFIGLLSMLIMKKKR